MSEDMADDRNTERAPDTVLNEAIRSGQGATEIPARLHEKLNEQIRHEFTAAYSYLAMSAWCEAKSLRGCAHWLRQQAEEEVEHALKFYDFILDRGSQVTLDALPPPRADFGSPLELFRAAYTHEQRVTRLIHDLYALSIEERDFASQGLVQWFVSEQVEEEKLTAEVVNRLELAGDDGAGLLLIDRELSTR